MNSSTNFNSGHTNSITDPGYRIQKIENCQIVTGHVPLSDMELLIQGFSDRAVMATDIASRIGATLVIGEPEDIERLRLCDLPISDQRLRDAELARKAGLPGTVIQWLLTGERGLSSDALCAKLILAYPKEPVTTIHTIRAIFAVACCFSRRSMSQTNGGSISFRIYLRSGCSSVATGLNWSPVSKRNALNQVTIPHHKPMH